MNDQFKAEPCQLYIQQEIKARLDEGKTAYQIDKELRREIKKYFEAEINPGTIEKRAQRTRKVLDNSTDNTNSVRTDKIKSVRNYRMNKARRALFARAEKIGKHIANLSIEETISLALDILENKV